MIIINIANEVNNENVTFFKKCCTQGMGLCSAHHPRCKGMREWQSGVEYYFYWTAEAAAVLRLLCTPLQKFYGSKKPFFVVASDSHVYLFHFATAAAAPCLFVFWSDVYETESQRVWNGITRMLRSCFASCVDLNFWRCFIELLCKKL